MTVPNFVATNCVATGWGTMGGARSEMLADRAEVGYRFSAE